MLIYTITLILVLVFGYIAQSGDYFRNNEYSTGIVAHTHTARVAFIAITVILIFVSGFRYGGSGDYFGYYGNFLKYANDLGRSIRELDEPGIRLICWIVAKFTTNGTVPILIYAIITIGLAMKVIFKHTDKLLIAVLLFIFLGCWHESFNAIRQCIAASIVFSGYDYLKDRKFFKYAIVVFIAFLFHSSALIMLVPFFFIHNRVTPRNVILLIIGSIVVLKSYDIVFGLTETLLNKDMSADMVYATRTVNIFRIAVAVLPAAYYLFKYAGVQKSNMVEFYLNMLIIHAAIMLMASNSAYLARVGIYTALFSCIAIPELNKINEHQNQKVIMTMILIFYALYWLYDISGFNFSAVEMQMIWQKG